MVQADKPTGDKVLRAEPLAAQCEARNVKMINASWNQRALDILTSFPNGIKDMVDAASGAFKYLHHVGAGTIQSDKDYASRWGINNHNGGKWRL